MAGLRLRLRDSWNSEICDLRPSVSIIKWEIAELRRATDNPVFFTDDIKDEQHPWTDDLAKRVV